MRTTSKVVVATAALALAGTGVLSTANASGGGNGGGRADGHAAVGLAGGGTTLVGFGTNRPDRAWTGAPLSGLVQDTRLVGIDFRVQDGKLYGVGDQGGIYVLDVKKSRAYLQERPRVALDGSDSYDIDFNPAADALRILTAKGANLRVPFATPSATVVDTPLTRPAPAPTPGTVPATGVTGGAYTNNDLDASTATTLFVIDTERDQVAVQSPANAGTTAPTGSLGVDATGDVGFDVRSELKRGKTVSVQGYAVVGGVLYDVDLLTGAAYKQGRIGGGQVTDLAVSLDR
jgi:hypothetical protein